MPVIFADVEGEYEKDADLKKEDVMILRDWLTKQPHLPDICELKLICFLHAAYYNIEKAKVLLENFYTAKAHAPDMFLNRNVNDELIQKAMKIGYQALLPTTDEGYHVVYGRIVNNNPDLMDFNAGITVFDMSASLFQMQQGIAPGHVMILDSKGLKLGHALKVDFATTVKLTYYLQECYPHRLKGIHIINVSQLNLKLYKFIKPLMKKEFVDMIHFHPIIDTLYDFVPKRIMPREYGGESPSIKELHEISMQNIMDNYEFFEKENFEFADESKRLGRRKTAADVFGMEGTFRKLEID